MTLSRRRFLAGLSVASLTPVLAACAGPAESGGGAGGEAAPDETKAAFPVTIAHKYGQTTIESAPKRVVCVGLVEQDALLALGVVPVGITYWFGDAPGQIFPWATEALDGGELPTVLRDNDGVQVEKIAELAPDLIIGQYSGLTRKDYDLLSKLAPVVAQPKAYADYGVPWEESTATIGKAIGRSEEAARLVDAVQARIAKEAADHPEFAGKAAAVVTPYEGLFVYGPEDPRGRMLEALGFAFPEALRAGSNGEFGWSVSEERTSDLADLDTVVWLDYDAASSGMTSLFERSPAFEQGRYFDIGADDGAFYVAQSMVTPLSIPYVLDRYVPMLAAAVDGDPGTEPPAASS